MTLRQYYESAGPEHACVIHRGQQVTVFYDGKLEQQRRRVAGKVVTFDHIWKIPQANDVAIDFVKIHIINLRSVSVAKIHMAGPRSQ